MPKAAQRVKKYWHWHHNTVVGQALIRLFFGFLFTAYAFLAYIEGIFGNPTLLLTYSGSTFIFLAALFLIVAGFVPSDNWFFKLSGMTLDILFATLTMTLGDSSMAFLYGIYLWIIIGNGLRFGRRYMYVANVLSLIGFSCVLVLSKFWQEYVYIGGGLMLWLLLMPIYIGKLLSKLENAVEQADNANKAKSQFLANMSHEIRTPLTAIIGFSETALDLQQTNEQRLESLAIIRQSGNHLLNLVNDILDFSKIDAGELIIETISMSPIQIVAEVESIMRVQAEKKSLQFTVEYVFPLPATIECDPVRLKQILLNLCSNAVKFTTSGEIHITVSYSAIEKSMAFAIRDTGIGMKQDDLEKVFKPFKQADSSTTRRFGGTGLGLSLSRQLAQLLGGTLRVNSRLEQGTTFTLSIPAGSVEQLINGLFEIEQTGSYVTKQHQVLLAGRILLAEDNLLNQRLLTNYLEKMGAHVTVANNGREACDLVTSSSFDLIYMDMQMPEMSGVEATRCIRAQGHTLPIVALTANATEQDRQLCRQSGFDDFVTKPIVRDSLYQVTARYLRSASSSAAEA